ncbi:PKD domain-containing protein, partial [Sphingopyxis granuli]|uniref:PKD domain-containing protein n=1 Tax=Sphingopyxis granuli TaxID=267128 RepID=UPI001A9E189B
VLAAIPAQSVEQGKALTVPLSASDADDAAETLVWSLVSGPAGATVGADGVFHWVATGAAGPREVVVRVTDPKGAFSEQRFTITVAAAANEAPVLAPIPAQSIERGRLLNVALSASDADDAAETLVYSLVSGPAGARVTADGRFEWIAAGAADTQMVTVRVTDPKGAFSEQSFAIALLASSNLPPVISPVAGIVVDEGQAVSVQLAASDPDGDASALVWTLVSGPEGASIDASGRFTWQALDGDATVPVVVRVTDAGGASAELAFAIAVRDVAPTLSVTGEATGQVAQSYTVLLGAVDPGQDTPIEWIIDWGDGSTPTRIVGTATAASHDYAVAGNYVVRATLVNEDGSFAAVPLALSIADQPQTPPLQVTQATIADGILTIRFSQPLGAEQAGRTVTLVGERFGAIAATIRYDADGQGFTLSRTDGKPLQYDRYSLFIGDDGFLSRDGRLLDGDGDGAEGGDYRASILFARAAAGTAELPDFVRGPGEQVDVPLADRAGLQVRFTSEGGVRTLSFRVTYDPALLTIDGILRGADLPADAVVDFRAEAAPGGKRVAIVSIVSDTPIPAGAIWLLSFDARVPADAPYGASERLTVTVDSINAAAPSSTRMDEAVQLVGFLDDRSPEFDALRQVERVVDGLPILSSSSAERPHFDAVTYGTHAAVAKWAGDIHATASGKTKKAKEIAAAKDAARKKDAKAETAPAAPRGRQTAVATIDFGATPVLIAKTEAPEQVDAPLVQWLAGAVDDGDALDLMPVALPALLLDRRSDPRPRRGKGRRNKDRK